MEPTTVTTWIGVVVTAGGVIAGTAKFCFWFIDEWQKRRTHQGFSAPKKTLQFAIKPTGNCWWSRGKQGNDPIMQIGGSMFVTNIASVPVRILQVELRYGFLGRKRVFGMAMVSCTAHEDTYGLHDIPPNETRDLMFDFWVYPPVLERSEPFSAHSVVFLDHFGNKHKLKRVVFRFE